MVRKNWCVREERKIMKKLIAVILVCTMIGITLTGCTALEKVPELIKETIVENVVVEEKAVMEEEAQDEIDEEEVKAAEEAAELEVAKEYYEKGRAALYGTEVNLEEAYQSFIKAKELGYTDANFYLGVLCDWYSYPKQDFEAARAFYETCKENPYAQISLAFLYKNGQGVEQDEEKAKKMFQAIIDQGCVEGYLGIAAFAKGEENYQSALDAFNKVLEGTEQIYLCDAMNSIGYMYANGEGVEQDYAKAMEWYEKAADLGDSDAINYIGYMYLNGLGVEQDYGKAMEWFEKAVDLENSNAMDNIAVMYENGMGVEQDYGKAMEWFEKAANLGDFIAMDNIALMYENGLGVEQDYGKAMEWFKKAADLGDSNAMHLLGYMFEAGKGVEKDYAKAMEWYEKAADLGHSTSTNNIGYMYENGLGVEQDYGKAMD